MKVCVWAIGKTSEKYLKEGQAIYLKKLKHYVPFSYEEFPAVKVNKNTSRIQVKKLEEELIFGKLKLDDYLILLDEKGKTYSSRAFSDQLNKWQNRPGKRLIFLIGGAFGFSEEMYKRSNAKLSLSSMTFSHQMVRLFLLEQLYRGYSIQRNEPYHND